MIEQQHRIAFLIITAFSLTFSSPIIPPRQGYQNLISTNSNSATLDVKTTIEEVQNMLETNPNLPRLTRGEIEDLFEQVTKEEYDKSMKIGDINRAKHMRALMLVLPFNSENISNDDLQEIYNRPPVTKVVSSIDVKPPKEQKIIVPSGKVEVIAVENLPPTTYKPIFKRRPSLQEPIPTTYHPNSEFMKIATTKNPIQSKLIESTSKEKSSTTNNNNKFSSHYNAKKTDFQQRDSTFSIKSSSKPKITPELEEILENLGFAAESQSKKRFKLEDPIDLPKPIISSLIKQDRISIDEYGPEVGAFSIDDFKKSLIPEIKPEDYLAFKPLSISKDSIKNIQPEIEDYLKMFGIIDEKERVGKSKNNFKESNDELLNLSTQSTKEMIESTTKIAIIPSHERTARIKRIDTGIDEDDIKTQVNHEDEETVQILQLINNIRQLQKLNISLNEITLKKPDTKNYDLNLSLLNQGPSPTENNETSDPIKNEIKRQSDSEPTKFSFDLALDEENDSETTETTDTIGLSEPLSPERDSNLQIPSSSTSDGKSITNGTPTTEATEISSTVEMTSTTEITTSTTTTTESPRRLDSPMDDGLDPITEDPLPKARKNGFYFLADWNSFLEVGEGDEQVVVRFNPKVGDPSRFIPVTIP